MTSGGWAAVIQFLLGQQCCGPAWRRRRARVRLEKRAASMRRGEERRSQASFHGRRSWRMPRLQARSAPRFPPAPRGSCAPTQRMRGASLPPCIPPRTSRASARGTVVSGSARAGARLAGISRHGPHRRRDHESEAPLYPRGRPPLVGASPDLEVRSDRCSRTRRRAPSGRRRVPSGPCSGRAQRKGHEPGAHGAEPCHCGRRGTRARGAGRPSSRRGRRARHRGRHGLRPRLRSSVRRGAGAASAAFEPF